MQDKTPSLSIVIPCHNEEEVIEGTCNTLIEIVNDWPEGTIDGFELVLVNNGSTDGTLNHMLSVQKEHDGVVIIDLRKNFGYQGSISAGLHHAKFDMVVTIDSDLQDDPTKIYNMIEEYKNGYELVLGVRKCRESDPFIKRITAESYYKLLKVLGVKSVYNHGDFRLMSRALVDEFKKLKESNRYLRSLLFELESRYAIVSYDRTQRTKGVSKFNPKQLVALAIDGITSFTSFPIRFITFIGLGMFLFSIMVGVYVLYMKTFGYADEVPGWTFLSALFLFFGGIQCLSIGIIGEYISKIFIEVKSRPLYAVRNVYK